MDPRYRKIGMAWAMAAKRAGADQASVPFAVYSIVMGRAPSSTLDGVDNPLELCNFIHVEETGQSLSRDELIELARHFRDGAGSSGLSMPPAMGCLMVLPNLILAYAVAAVFVRDFSWIVIAIAIIARVWHGFARWLVSGGQPLARAHVPFAVLSLALSLLISSLHIFKVFSFP